MQQPTGGAVRHADDQRQTRDEAPAPSLLTRLTSRATRAMQARLQARAAAAGAAMTGAVRPLATPERALPIAVAAIVAVAALLAFMPSTPQGAVGGVQGKGTDVRLAVNGGIQRAEATAPEGADAQALGDGGAGAMTGLVAPSTPAFKDVTLPEVTTQPASQSASLAAPVTDDGTLLTGYAPLTTVEDGADLIRTYKVKSGDTLASVAKKFKISTMTLWWANKLKAGESLKAGKQLRIPPVSGLVYTVKDTDTLDTLAAKYKIKADRIVELNGLEDPTLVVGQVLVLPGAKGAPMPTPRSSSSSTSKTASAGGGGGTAAPLGGKYNGGSFRWPVVGGDNYVSQYFHYGHYGLDIAADYGAKVVAAAGGKVTFAGWKSNGGGYQVWISHGGGLYTTYNHMSSVSVGRGQTVGKGEQVGRVGQSGNATGPHLHFEVWKGPVWDGGSRVNPLRYL